MAGRANKYWIVAKTKQSSSRDAIRNVRDQGFEFFHLTYRARAIRGIRKVTALFPYYLMIQVDDRKQDWKVLSSTKGISSIIPGRVDRAALDYFRRCTEKTDPGVYRYDDPAHDHPRFAAGASVEGLRGLFKEQYGTYLGLAGNSAARVRVLFSILGRDAEFEVRADDLREIVHIAA